jgi:hypothetical protein
VRKLTKTSNEEAGIDTLDGTEVDVVLAQEGINKLVENGDHDDDRDGIQIPVG